MKKLFILSVLFLIALVGSAAAALSGPGVGTTVSLGTAAVDATTSIPLEKASAFTLSNDATTVVSTITYGLKAATSGTAFPAGTTLIGTTPTSIAAAAGTPPVPATASVAVKLTFPVNTPTGTYTGVLTASDGTTTFDLVTVTAIISNTRNVVNDPTGTLVVDVDYASLRDRATTFNTTKSVTVKNTGVFTEAVTLTFAGVKTDFTGTLSTADSSFSLAPGLSKTVTLNVGVPLIASGTTKLGTLDIKFGPTASQTTTSVQVDAKVKSMLELVDIDVQVGEEDDRNLKDGDNIDAEAKPEDKVTFTFKVDNLFDKDYNSGDFEDVEISLKINDRDFGDDIDEDSKEFDLDAGEDKDDIDISFDVPEDADDGDYTVEITLSGVLKQTGTPRHTATAKLTLEVNLESDDVRIRALEPNPLTLQCSRDATISVSLKNQGKNDQDDVILNVDSSPLGINERFTGIQLDELGGRDDDARKEFRISLGDDFAAGTYEYEARVFIDGDKLQDSERGTVRVEDCARRTGTTTTGTSTVNGGATTVVVQPPPVTTQPPAAPTTPTGAAATDFGDDIVDSVETSFTQSPLFLVLLVLGNVVVLGLIVFIIVKVAVK